MRAIGLANSVRGDAVCGELLLVARLNNSPTHEKRPKAYAEPKAAGLSVGGGQNLHVRPSVDRALATRARPRNSIFWSKGGICLDRSELRVEVWPLERVVPYAKNPRVISSAAIEKVASSIKQFGFRQPIVYL